MTGPRAMALALVLASASGCGACGKTQNDGLVFGPAALPDGAVGAPYRAELTVGGTRTPVAGMSVAKGTLPPGVELHFDRGAQKDGAVLEGTPTAPGDWSFTVSAGCFGTNVSGQSGAHEYRIVIR